MYADLQNGIGIGDWEAVCPGNIVETRYITSLHYGYDIKSGRLLTV